MTKRKYDVGYRKPSMGNKLRWHGWKEGLKRVEVFEFIIECFTEKGSIETIRFDNKEVIPDHKERLIHAARLWAEIRRNEREIKPGAARLARSGRDRANDLIPLVPSAREVQH